VPPTFPFTGLDPIEIFAVEDRVAQLAWRNLPEGEVGVVSKGRDQILGTAGRPGAGEVTNLDPAASNPISITLDGKIIAQRTVQTTPSIEGPPLARIATISDLHLGEVGFGLVKEIRDTSNLAEPYPLRCAKAAVREATAWGADLLVIKGDITELGLPDHWELFDELLADITIPVMAIPGNHDTFGNPGSLNAADQLRRRGLFSDEVTTLDMPGVRIAAADTTTPGHTWGRIRHLSERLTAAVDTELPTVLFLHHHLETHFYPRIWPLGTPKRQGLEVLNELVVANPDLLVSSGHTHRNRARRHSTAVLTEVSATKDHPGVWAGYVAHAGGIRQVVRRVAEPSCLEWNDRTHAAVGGIWGKWSPGRLDERSFVHSWSRQRSVDAPLNRLSLASG
jgi:Icc-related predicted phosphoesterase